VGGAFILGFLTAAATTFVAVTAATKVDLEGTHGFHLLS